MVAPHYRQLPAQVLHLLGAEGGEARQHLAHASCRELRRTPRPTVPGLRGCSRHGSGRAHDNIAVHNGGRPPDMYGQRIEAVRDGALHGAQHGRAKGS